MAKCDVRSLHGYSSVRAQYLKEMNMRPHVWMLIPLGIKATHIASSQAAPAVFRGDVSAIGHSHQQGGEAICDGRRQETDVAAGH